MNSALRHGSGNRLFVPNCTAVGEPNPISTTLGSVSGDHTGTRKTGPDGFTLPGTIVADSVFKATGTMTTTLDSKTYTQPPNA